MRSFIRPTSATVASIALLAAGAGIATAAAGTSKPTHAVACVNTKGSLVLAQNGTCGKGLARVSLPLSTVSGPRGATGPSGAAGPAGPAGPTGVTGGTGPSGISHYQLITGSTTSIPGNGSEVEVFVACPAGTSIIGGGVYELSGAIVASDYPYIDPSTSIGYWIGYFNNTTPSATIGRAYAICANVSI